mmetsp:Transcript_6859/g.22039  ORF Transcript_6859/g.22039 Transcript_6859/m.22039 type:complete len:156 (+) Transcript_6859:95-562(+)
MKRIGLAVSEASWRFSEPKSIISAERPIEQVRKDILEVCEQYEVGGVVVGWPLIANDDKPGKQCVQVAQFMQELNLHEFPKALWDERYTSAMALLAREEAAEIDALCAADPRRRRRGKVMQSRSRLNRQANDDFLDAEAAAVMLQSFLDAQARAL